MLPLLCSTGDPRAGGKTSSMLVNLLEPEPGPDGPGQARLHPSLSRQKKKKKKKAEEGCGHTGKRNRESSGLLKSIFVALAGLGLK